MTIVYAAVDDLFAELKMKKIQEARLEAVATITRDKRNVRIVSFCLHVTAEINGLLINGLPLPQRSQRTG